MGNLNSISVSAPVPEEDAKRAKESMENTAESAAHPTTENKNHVLRAYSNYNLPSRITYDVKVIKAPPRHVIATSRECTIQQKDTVIPQQLAKVREHIAKLKAKIIGPPFACLHNQREDNEDLFTLDVGYPVEGSESLRGNDFDIFLAEFSGGEVAQIIHVGDNSGTKLASAYSFLKSWAIKNNKKRDRDPWEDYVVDRDKVKDPKDIKTAINMAIS